MQAGGGSGGGSIGGKKYAAFVSHHKRDAALAARFLKDRLEPVLGHEIFL